MAPSPLREPSETPEDREALPFSVPHGIGAYASEELLRRVVDFEAKLVMANIGIEVGTFETLVRELVLAAHTHFAEGSRRSALPVDTPPEGTAEEDVGQTAKWSWDELNRRLNTSLIGAVKNARDSHPEIGEGYVSSITTRVRKSIKAVLIDGGVRAWLASKTSHGSEGQSASHYVADASRSTDSTNTAERERIECADTRESHEWSNGFSLDVDPPIRTSSCNKCGMARETREGEPPRYYVVRSAAFLPRHLRETPALPAAPPVDTPEAYCADCGAPDPFHRLTCVLVGRSSPARGEP